MLRAWFARVIIYFIGEQVQTWMLIGQRQQQQQLIVAIEALRQQIAVALTGAKIELQLTIEATMLDELAQHRAQTIDHIGKVVQQLLLVMRQLNNYTTVRAVTHQEALLHATEECMAVLSTAGDPCHQ